MALVFVCTGITGISAQKLGCRFTSKRRIQPRATMSLGQVSGYAARFSGSGIPIDETTVQAGIPTDEDQLQKQATLENPMADTDLGLIVYQSGASSRGPRTLDDSGNFVLVSRLVNGDCERLTVSLSYVGGVRSHIELSWEAVTDAKTMNKPGPFLNNPPLESSMIAGKWVATNFRWSANAPPTIKNDLQRDYGMNNSTSPSLVRLPLGVSVVAPPSYFRGSTLSFGAGWLPEYSTRPVMVRSYSSNGSLEKVDWRIEHRQQ